MALTHGGSLARDVGYRVLPSVATSAGVASIPPDIRVDGATVTDRQSNKVWQFHETSSLPASVGVIVPIAGIGRWFDTALGSPAAANQPAWFIDPASGDDSNDGATSATAIKTHAEFMSRLGKQVINRAITVTLMNDVPVDEPWLVQVVIGDNGFLRYVGVPTELATGTFTAVTNLNPATNQPCEVTDTALSGDWGALGLIDKRIRTTGGSVPGAIAWAAKDLTGKAARTSTWSVPNADSYPVPFSFGQSNVATTDPYVVEDLPSIPVLKVQAIISQLSEPFPASAKRLIFDSLSINKDFSFSVPYRYAVISGDRGDGIAFVKSHINAPQCVNGGGYFHSCRMDPYQTSGTAESTTIEACLIQTYFNVNVHSTVFIRSGTLVQDGVFTDWNGRVLIGNNGGVGFMDCGAQAIRVSANAVVRQSGPVWGADNSGVAWQLFAGAEVISLSAGALAKVTLDSATDDTKIGGTTKAYADLPYVETSNLAMFVVEA